MGACALSFSLMAQGQGVRVVSGTGMIDTPGNYVLVNDATQRSHGSAILITANNVYLDLNGNTVLGPGGKNGVGIRIRGVNGVKVTNGYIVNHAFGVIVENSNDVTLANLQIRGEGLVVTAPPPETAIMVMQSRGVVIRNNTIYNTGLGVFVRGGRSGGNMITGNTITGGMNAILGICYNPTDNDPNGPRGDLISDNLISGFNIGLQFSDRSAYNIARGNTIVYRSMASDIRNNTNREVGTESAQLQ
jgi:parallel beta-helix repeat protein